MPPIAQRATERSVQDVGAPAEPLSFTILYFQMAHRGFPPSLNRWCAYNLYDPVFSFDDIVYTLLRLTGHRGRRLLGLGFRPNWLAVDRGLDPFNTGC